MDLSDLYQELIIDHGAHPRNCRALEKATHEAEGFNPLCGDKVHLYLNIRNNIIQEISFTGTGCAISMSSASLMTEVLCGKSLEETSRFQTMFHSLLTHQEDINSHQLGKLSAFSHVNRYPARVKCATLAWHALQHALEHKNESASTE